MKKTYDVIVVGAGPAGMMCAYELQERHPGIRLLLIDKGKSILERRCPILEGKLKKCPQNKKGYRGCLPYCSITHGFGGAGAYSDGKFNITSEFGGWLDDYLETGEIKRLIERADQINLSFGAPKETTDPDTEAVRDIEKRGMAIGIKLLRARVRHLGTEVNLNVLKNMHAYLDDKIDMVFEKAVEEIIVQDKTIKGIVTDDKQTAHAKHVIIAPGRGGSDWLKTLCLKQGIGLQNNHVDLGVRVETDNRIMEEINKHLYEGKFIFRTENGNTVRTFCQNPSGHVVMENHGGTILANGHSYASDDLSSSNTNFALLVSHSFTEPFNQPNEFAHSVSRLANMLSNGSIIVQKYGDLKKNRRSTYKRIGESFVTPTLKEAVPGDLGLVLPYKTMLAIVDMIEAFDTITPGIASDHTLLYGVEAKFYSARPEINNHFESSIENLYFAGDGAGLTRGLAQASANGIHIARTIAERMTSS